MTPPNPNLPSGYTLPSVRPRHRSHPDCRSILILIDALHGLQGARLVLVTEVEAGRAWAESRIKAITGGEAVTARFMRRDYFQYMPQFKLVVAGNHRPALTRVGEAMRRRLHVVPFTVTIPSERRDRHLAEKLLAERDGILSWMLEGCAEWQKAGLRPPSAVLTAAEEYFADEDVVGQWIAEACCTGRAFRATAQELFASWSAWAKDRGHEAGSQKSLGDLLRERSFSSIKVRSARGWAGIAVRRGAPGGEGSK